MEFAFHGTVPPQLEAFAAGLRDALVRHGYTESDPATAKLVCNFVDGADPKPYRRESKSTFVASFWPATDDPEDPNEVLRRGYPVLVRALSNMSVSVVPGICVRFLTPERGNYAVPWGDGGSALFEGVVERLAPLAESDLVIDNIFTTDLEPELWGGDEATESIAAAGRRLDEWGLLPAPFPIEDFLSKRDRDHIMRLYSIGGLSYGNLSTRKDATRFWMSASGVDKSKLVEIGRDMMLVTGYDAAAQSMKISIPPGVTPRRVSVDAIEHWKIYLEHPTVGAILHVHAWVDGITATDVNYPCGTAQLADAVADLVRIAPDPGRCIIGLRNHGLTITGPSLEEIFDRVGPHIQKQVPMT